MEFTNEEMRAVEVAILEKQAADTCERESLAPMMSGGGFGDVAF